MSNLTLLRYSDRTRQSANGLNWILTLSGVMFVMLALNFSRGTDSLLYKLLKSIIPLTGLVLSLTAAFGASGAVNIVRVLKRKWKKLKDQHHLNSFNYSSAGGFTGISKLLLAIPVLIIWLTILILILVGKILLK